MYRILLVEDDFDIQEELGKLLKKWNYEPIYIKDFNQVLDLFIESKPQLVLMDISLPYYNGYYWCQEIRKVSQVPIIFLSSYSDHLNMVMAMDMGADDFIVKPFDSEVLMAKLKAILRRTYDFNNETTILEHKGILLNMEMQTIHYQGQSLSLSKNDYRILLCLYENKNKVVSRETLMERLWQTDSFIDENTLTVNMNRLRKKLQEIGIKDFIQTKFGQGYTI